MKQYLELLEHVMLHGEDRSDRTGTGTRAVFGYQMRINLQNGFPLLTTKKVFWKGVVVELLWFISGDTNIRWLVENGVSIWNEWADENGDLGPVYGKQWRDFNGVDQLQDLIDNIESNPFSRRLVVSAWNPKDTPYMKLPPCHTLWQCQVSADKSKLNLHLYCRSIDSFLGLPFNIASYALLLTLIAKVTSKLPNDLIISFGDLHIYKNHFEQVREQLSRKPRKLPIVDLNYHDCIDDYCIDDIFLQDYDPYPAIKAPVSV